jgi:hypothetical protein
MVPVMELHSHNSMAAFWSGTDDAHERANQFYMVMGKLDSTLEYKVRFCAGGKFVDTNLFTIVEPPVTYIQVSNDITYKVPTVDEFLIEIPFPAEWMDKLEKPILTAFKNGVHLPAMGFSCDSESDKKKWGQLPSIDSLPRTLGENPTNQETEASVEKTGEATKETGEEKASQELGSLKNKMDAIRNKLRI